ncbi:hypothetical protein Tco_1270771 [Tanacetum coccineum]
MGSSPPCPKVGVLVATPRGTTQVVTYGNPTRPGPRPDQTRLLTGGQPLLTGGPAVVDRWSATVDRHWPPLTAVGPPPLTGGSVVALVTAGRPRGTTQVVTRGTTNDWYEVLCRNGIPMQSCVNIKLLFESVEQEMSKMPPNLELLLDEYLKRRKCPQSPIGPINLTQTHQLHLVLRE